MIRILKVIFLLMIGIMLGFAISKKLSSSEGRPVHVVTEEFRQTFNTDGERLLSIAGTKNFRDLGGYQTVDGSTVKWNMIYRADNLAHLDSDGISAFSALNIKAITDLRSEAERIQEPNIIPATYPGPVYNVLPINDRSVDIKALGRKIVTGKITDEEIDDLLDHRKFITNSRHRSYWGGWLADLAQDNSTPHLFHCTSGKDRTGFGASIFLLALGVPEETVKADFLLSNSVLADYNDDRIKEIDDRVPGKIDEAVFRRILGVSEKTIDLSFDRMKSDYGSIDGFIRDGLGIDDDTRRQLQNKFLEP